MDKHEEHILLKTTAYIKPCDKNQKILGYATCVFCKNDDGTLYFVTNNHVIEKSQYFLLYLTIKDEINNKVYNTSVFCECNENVIKHPKYDLCIVNISSVCNKLISENQIPIISYIPLNYITTDFSSFNHIEEIYMVGYPNRLINLDINYPIVRKGITATGLCDKLSNEDAFIIDIPVYRGSSGSPVYYISNDKKIKLVGIVTSKYYETNNIFKDNGDQINEDKSQFVYVPNGLGYAIKANVILELLNIPHKS